MSLHSDTILIPSQTDFVLTPYCCVPSGETVHTNFIVLVFDANEFEPTINSTPSELTNNSTIDVVHVDVMMIFGV